MSLFKSAATVGGLTMVSRVLGFIRDILMASVLGAGMVMDVYVIAFRFPNLFRRIFGEGAFNAAFVPLFAKRLEGEGRAAAANFAEEVFSGLLFVLLILIALAELFMPLLMYLLAGGFAGEPEKFDLAILMTRIAFPYLLFMSLVALLSGLLNSFHRYTAAAAAPILLNIVLIVVLAVLISLGWGSTPASGQALVWGVSFAGLLQFVVLYFAAVRAGITLKLRRPRMTDGVRRLITLGIPGVIAGGITQINLLISTFIASFQDGAPSWLYYADRLYQLPLGVVGVAIGIVLLPELSRRLRAEDHDGVHNSQNRAIEFSMLLTMPAAIALMAIPYPVIQVLFERGQFEASDTLATAQALAAFAAGLPAFVLIKVFSPGFFAREDTRTPMMYAGVAVAINVIGAIALMPVLGHVGIAIATTVSAWVNAALLATTLSQRGAYQTDERLRYRLPRILISSLVMGAVLLTLTVWSGELYVAQTHFAVRVAGLAMLVAIGTAIYFALAASLSVLKLDEIKTAMRRG